MSRAVENAAFAPAGQFAVHNATDPELRRLFVLPAGHFDYPEMAQTETPLRAELRRFFAEL